MSRSGRAAKGFLTSLLQYSSNIAVQALLAPVVLRVAGREALGAYAAVMQAVGFLGLVDIAGSWSLERFLAQSIGLDDGGARFRLIFTTAKTLLLITNVVFAMLVIVFSIFIAPLFHLSPGIAHQAQHALYVIAVWAVVRTPLAAYSTASIATQDLAAVNLIGALLGAVRGTASLLFVLAGGGLFGLMLSGTLVEACGTVLFRMRFKKVNPGLMPGWGIPDKPLLREMTSFGAHAMFLNIGNMLVFTSGNAIAGMTNGAAVASTFYTSQMPTMTAYMMILRLSDSATPAVHELYGRREMERVKVSFQRLSRFLLLLAMPLATGVFLFNRDLVVSWVGPAQYGGKLLTVTLAAFCVLIALQRVAMVFSFVFGWMRLLTTTGFAQGVANLGLAWFLGKRIGLGGITLALVLVVLPQTVILWYRLGQFFKMNVLAFLSGVAARLLVPLISASATSLLVHSAVTIRPRHLGGFLAEAFTFLFTYALIVYPFLVKHDRNDVNRYLKAFASGRWGLRQRLVGVVGESS